MSEIEPCKNDWLANLLYIQTFNTGKEGICLEWCWYLAMDFQFYVIAPLFIFLLYRYPIPGRVFLFLGFCGSLAARSIVYSSFNHPDNSHQWFYDIYIKPWYRFGSYPIGIALGYILHRIRRRPEVKLPMIGVTLAWLVAICLCVVAVFGAYDKGDCGALTDLPGGSYTVFRVVHTHFFSLGVAWIMFACSTGYGGFANTLLSWSGFVPVAKLSYAAYLIHPIIIYCNYYSRQRAVYVEDLTVTTLFCANFALTLVASLVLTLMFEVPMFELEKILLPFKEKND